MMLVISTNNNKIINGYAEIGGIEDGVNIAVDKIEEDLCAGYYKLVDGQIMLDEELKAKFVGARLDTPTAQWDKNV